MRAELADSKAAPIEIIAIRNLRIAILVFILLKFTVCIIVCSVGI